MDLNNDTVLNVAGLLKDQVGSVRVYRLRLDRFRLDEDSTATDVMGEVKLTRLRSGVMATVSVAGEVVLDCVRCLRPYGQPFQTEFSEEYRQTVDVRTGIGLDLPVLETDEKSEIDENHELDLADVLRQEILVVLPMRPDCGEECPGPESLGAKIESNEDQIDDRLAALGRLLNE